MMIIEEKFIYSRTFIECEFCGGSGRIKIYRGDWEEFDEIECENCKSMN